MNRIDQCLAKLKQEGRKALVTYIVNGDPDPQISLDAMHTLAKNGADIIELGVPFSDPMAEGPVIQRGHERALMHNVSLRDTFALVSEFRQKDEQTPVVIMGYANPIERIGYDTCASMAAQAGVDGVLTVDLPAEEAEQQSQYLSNQALQNIFLIAPTTTENRIQKIAELAGGFIYYVSLKGVTGAGHMDIHSVDTRLAVIKQHTDLPVLVGFGIKDAQSAAAVARVADGVVVGSVLVSAMGEAAGCRSEEICDRLTSIVVPIRQALDSI